MREAAGAEVKTNHVLTGDVTVVVNRITQSKRRIQRVLEIRISIERLGSITKVVVDLPDQVVFTEWLTKPGSETFKRRTGQNYWRERVLLGALAVTEEEQLVLDDRTAQTSCRTGCAESRGPALPPKRHSSSDRGRSRRLRRGVRWSLSAW